MAALTNRLFRLALLVGVFVAPAYAHTVPIITYPTSGEGTSANPAPGLLSIMQTLSAMQQQLRSLENQAEITNHKIDLLRRQQQSLLRDIDLQMHRLVSREGGQAPGAATPPAASPNTTQPPGAATGSSAVSPPTAPPGSPKVTVVPPDTRQASSTAKTPGTPNVTVVPPHAGASGKASTAKTAYAHAFDLLRAGQYDHAVAAFKAFLARYPKDERDARAQYWMAETEYMEHDYAAAAQSFHAFVHAYPQSARVPNAMLKLGYMKKWQGHPDKARMVWLRLVSRYPASTAAQVARGELMNLPTKAGSASSPTSAP